MRFNLGTMLFRLAEPAEATVVSEILEEAAGWLTPRGIRQWVPGWRTPDNCLQSILRRETYVVLDEPSDAVVATFRLTTVDQAFGERPPDALYVQALCVRRSASHRQLGAVILAWCEGQVALAGRAYLRLDCVSDNAWLNAYYQAAGYQAIGTYVYDLPHGPLPCTLYQKRIVPTPASR
jgi:protein-tyrosine phosphatase